MNTDTGTTYTCPHCHKPTEVPMAVMNNCQRYFSKPVFRTRCCGYGIRLVPHFYVTLAAMPHDTARDSFGVTLKQDKES
jgi:hypothetical protein